MKYIKYKILFVCSVLIFFSFSFVVTILNEWRISRHTKTTDDFYNKLMASNIVSGTTLSSPTTRLPTAREETAEHKTTTTSRSPTSTAWPTTNQGLTTTSVNKSPTEKRKSKTQLATTTSTTTQPHTLSQKTATTQWKRTRQRIDIATTIAQGESTTQEPTSMQALLTTQQTTATQTRNSTMQATTTQGTTTPKQTSTTQAMIMQAATTQATTVTIQTITPFHSTLTENKTTAESTMTTMKSSVITPGLWHQKFYDLGCYLSEGKTSDYPYLVVNLRDDIDWNNMTKTVIACADFIKKPETIKRYGELLKFFAIKFYGECWAKNESAAPTYYYRGKDNGCYENTGDHDTVYVYHFGPSERPPDKNIVSVGCYADGASLPIKHLIGNFITSGATSESDGTRVASDCYKLVWERGYSLFGLKNKGECWSGPDAHMTYNNDGAATDCVHGLGSANSFSVYKLES
ncbi:uncharacterized protein LOC135689984 [Rhopilema esculentum]|uniref:uncharacterized protein LOC135689984 n=1 Tax=Rhopilema esculentum TaxID=499914 RepID=UPI0031DAA117